VKVLIVGAGISGLFIAYELAKRGVKDVTVVDRGYPGGGGTFRSAACFRASFTSREHVVLMKESISRWLRLRDELGIEVAQRGYLWVARREETVELFKKLVQFHNSLGVSTRVLSADEVVEVEPGINRDLIVGGMFDPTAGRMPLFENFVQLYTYIKSLGVRFQLYTEVYGFKASGKRVETALTSRGEIRADVFVIAAAEGSRRILGSLNIDVPIVAEPRHAFISEPYAQTLRPALIVDWDTAGAPYVTQTSHGGFLMARNFEDEPWISIHSNRYDTFGRVLRPLAELLPFLRRVNIVRYWMGYYDTTPDHHPIYGPVEDFENLFIAAGFSGHGVMIAPATGAVVADWILRGEPSIPEAKNLTLERFKTGRLVKEVAVIG